MSPPNIFQTSQLIPIRLFQAISTRHKRTLTHNIDTDLECGIGELCELEVIDGDGVLEGTDLLTEFEVFHQAMVEACLVEGVTTTLDVEGELGVA